MSPPAAVLDACVLYSASLRDLFMWLADAKLYHPKWTEQIHQEWIESLLKNRPDLTWAKLGRTRHLMNLRAENSLVEGYEYRIAALALPDANDRHVLAAAIEAGAPLIVTFNLSDFPKQILINYGIEAQHPDVFLSNLLDQNEEAFLGTLQKMITALKNPPRTLAQQLDVLRGQGLTKTATRIANKR